MVEYKVPKIIVIQLGSVISKEMHSEIEVKKVMFKSSSIPTAL